MAAACAKAKRDPKEVTLIAVTKTASPEAIREIIQLGVVDLGESRVQQLQQRAGTLAEQMNRRTTMAEAPTSKPVRWHMIGHLQRNKVKPLMSLIHCIHSVDSLRLAEEIDTAAAKIGRKMPVMMQVNASEESQKFGVAIGAALHLGEQVAQMPNVQLVGLMTMAAFDADERALRQTFSRTREVFEEMKWHKIGGPQFRHLSMGMSHDYPTAIEEGATMVRVGSALFGGNVDGGEETEES